MWVVMLVNRKNHFLRSQIYKVNGFHWVGNDSTQCPLLSPTVMSERLLSYSKCGVNLPKERFQALHLTLFFWLRRQQLLNVI